MGRWWVGLELCDQTQVAVHKRQLTKMWMEEAPWGRGLDISWIPFSEDTVNWVKKNHHVLVPFLLLWWHQYPDKNNQREKVFILALSLRIQSKKSRKGWSAGSWENWSSHNYKSRSKERMKAFMPMLSFPSSFLYSPGELKMWLPTVGCSLTLLHYTHP